MMDVDEAIRNIAVYLVKIEFADYTRSAIMFQTLLSGIRVAFICRLNDLKCSAFFKLHIIAKSGD
tara:strand:- start:24587 stop:24781 length:195 start_codon:yes stop_codon:yes gene_type:complete